MIGCGFEGAPPGMLLRPPPPSGLQEASGSKILPSRGSDRACHLPWAPGFVLRTAAPFVLFWEILGVGSTWSLPSQASIPWSEDC